MTSRLIAIALALLAACAGPLPPRWQTDAHASLENFERHYLGGNTELANRDFAEAKAAIAGTGSLELAARAELIRCALATAALDFDACAILESVTGATAEDQAYAAFLAGRWDEMNAGALPDRYRSIAKARDETAQSRELRAIEDPVSRLVAAGVLFRLGRISPASVSLAVDTASAQGLRRPVLAWLNVQAKLAEAAGDTASMEFIRKRIDLVHQSLLPIK